MDTVRVVVVERTRLVSHRKPGTAPARSLSEKHDTLTVRHHLQISRFVFHSIPPKTRLRLTPHEREHQRSGLGYAAPLVMCSLTLQTRSKLPRICGSALVIDPRPDVCTLEPTAM